MEEPFEQLSWSTTDQRYQQIELISLQETLAEQKAMQGSLSAAQKRRQAKDEAETLVQVATPEALKKNLTEQETLEVAASRNRGRPGESSIAGDDEETLKVAAVRRPLTIPGRPGRQADMHPGNHSQASKNGTFAYDIKPPAADEFPEFDELATIPMLVVRSISEQQASPQQAERQPAMRSEISQAAGGAAYVSIGNIAGSLIKYGSNIVIQRGFGAAAFGLYTLGMSVVSLITAIFNLGLDDAMVRYVAIYKAKRKAASLRGLIIFCTALAGISGVLGALFMVFTAPYLAAVKRSPELTPILILISPMVPFLCMQTIWISGLQGLKEFKGRVLTQRVFLPVSLIFLLLAALIFFHSLQAIVIATVIYGLIGALISLYMFFHRIAGLLKPGPVSYELRDWFGFAAPNFLTSVIDTVLQSIDTLLLAFFAISNVAIGQYAAAIKISSNILIPQYSFNAMFAPMIAELHSQGEHQKLAALFHIVTKWSITFSLPIFWIATLFSVSLLSISGPQFVAAWPLLIAFSIGTLINVGTGSVGYILLMTGHTRISFLNSLTAVLVDIAVGVALTPRYGAMGVAIATGTAVSVVNLMRLLQVRILVKMQPYSWDVLKPLSAGCISALITGALLYLLDSSHIAIQVSHYHVSLDLSLVPVFLAIYTGLLILFKVGPEDKIVLDMLRRKLRRGKKR